MNQDNLYRVDSHTTWNRRPEYNNYHFRNLDDHNRIQEHTNRFRLLLSAFFPPDIDSVYKWSLHRSHILRTPGRHLNSLLQRKFRFDFYILKHIRIFLRYKSHLVCNVLSEYIHSIHQVLHIFQRNHSYNISYRNMRYFLYVCTWSKHHNHYPLYTHHTNLGRLT
jgi:hypothetical protein